jgi:hypothetical protein
MSVNEMEFWKGIIGYEARMPLGKEKKEKGVLRLFSTRKRYRVCNVLSTMRFKVEEKQILPL